MSKLTIGQNGAVYWRDDALSVDYIVRAFNDRADQIQRLERERDEWKSRYEEIAQGSEAVWEGKPTDDEVEELAKVLRATGSDERWHDTPSSLREYYRKQARAAVAHIGQPPCWPTPEDAAKFRQNRLSQRHNWGDWEEFSELYQREHTSVMAATLDWIKKGCPDD
jgi:hypothetical protein